MYIFKIIISISSEATNSHVLIIWKARILYLAKHFLVYKFKIFFY